MMQVTPTPDMAILGIPGVVIGLILGNYFGGFESFRAVDRIGIGIISSIFLGVISTVVMKIFIDLTTFEAIFIVLSYFGGYILGAASNWAPTPKKSSKSHIIYEPDDDDDEAFDREIEDALSGGYEANNS
ncbi:MAG: hypothetical protein ACFFDM_06910 [Candidatus Thorarchaeota archaeon]